MSGENGARIVLTVEFDTLAYARVARLRKGFEEQFLDFARGLGGTAADSTVEVVSSVDAATRRQTEFLQQLDPAINLESASMQAELNQPLGLALREAGHGDVATRITTVFKGTGRLRTIRHALCMGLEGITDRRNLGVKSAKAIDSAVQRRTGVHMAEMMTAADIAHVCTNLYQVPLEVLGYGILLKKRWLSVGDVVAMDEADIGFAIHWDKVQKFVDAFTAERETIRSARSD